MGTLDMCLKGSTVCVAAYGSSLVRRGHLTAGQLTAFSLYSGLAGMGLAGLLRSAVCLASLLCYNISLFVFRRSFHCCYCCRDLRSLIT